MKIPTGHEGGGGGSVRCKTPARVHAHCVAGQRAGCRQRARLQVLVEARDLLHGEAAWREAERVDGALRLKEPRVDLGLARALIRRHPRAVDGVARELEVPRARDRRREQVCLHRLERSERVNSHDFAIRNF
eukprot:2412108-Pleurochrysis_carterae.AAC.3